MKIHYFLFEVVPHPESDNFEEAGGAFINCWIYSDSKQEAEETAIDCIESDGWIIKARLEYLLPDREWYSDNPDSLEMYDLALEQGESYIFNLWSPDPQEDDAIH